MIVLPYYINDFNFGGDNDMFCTFYGRVSTDSNQQLSALDNQEDYWKDYFKSNNLKMNPNCGAFFNREGVLVPRGGYYIDEGISGYKSKKYRKAFMKMINDARLKKFDMIYTRSISRFGRNVEDIITTINDLRRNNVGVYFEDINANTLDRNDDFKIHIFMGLAQEESRLKSASVQKGKMTAAEKGVWSGREPFGYDIYTGVLEIDGVRQFVKGRLVINESEAGIVKEIFDAYLNKGWGLSKIAKYLNSKDVPRKRNSNKWDQSIIGKMLKNPIYKGTVWQHRTYKRDPQQNIIVNVPVEEQIVFEDTSLLMIDPETFDKVQELKEERLKMFGDFKYKIITEEDELGNELERKVRVGIDRASQRYSGAHLFSNLLRCGNCHSPLRFKKQKSTSGRIHHYWFCSSNDKDGRCKYRNLQKDEELIEWVKQEIETFKLNDFQHKDIIEKMIKLQFDSDGDNESKIRNLNEKLSELKEQSDTNLYVLSKGYIEETEFAERSRKLNNQMSILKNELEQLKNIDLEKCRLVAQFNDFVEGLKKIDTKNLSNATLRKIIDKIVFTTNDLDLNYGAMMGYVHLPEPKEIHWKYMGQSVGDLSYEYTSKYFKVGDDEYIDPWTLLPIK